MLLPYLVGIVCVLALILYERIRRAYQYWHKRGIKGPKPQIIYGNYRSVFKRQNSLITLPRSIYEQYPNEKVIGMYLGFAPTLIICDPELITDVLIKNFSHFVSRGLNMSKHPLMKNLFTLDGDEWRVLRQKLSPVFSSGKLKQMMPMLNECVKGYKQYLEELLSNPEPIEMRSITMKYTLKGITSVAFGLDINPFTKEKDRFIKMANKIVEPNINRGIIALLHSIKPGLSDFLGVKPCTAEVENFFIQLVKETIRQREGKPKVRKDLMDFMIELREEGKITKAGDDYVSELEFTEPVMMAQAILFYAAGHETTAGTMAFLMYELACNPDKQELCYQEIKEVMEKYNGELTFEAIDELEYVYMAFQEAMRKYPVAGVLFRECDRPYEFKELSLKIQKGTKILIPAMALHMDPKYFPEPEKFLPERFAPENRNKIRDCTFLPFGDGPRNCIGMRFAKLTSVLAIAHMLYTARIELCERTPRPLDYDHSQITLTSKDGIWLVLKRR